MWTRKRGGEEASSCTYNYIVRARKYMLKKSQQHSTCTVFFGIFPSLSRHLARMRQKSKICTKKRDRAIAWACSKIGWHTRVNSACICTEQIISFATHVVVGEKKWIFLHTCSFLGCMKASARMAVSLWYWNPASIFAKIYIFFHPHTTTQRKNKKQPSINQMHMNILSPIASMERSIVCTDHERHTYTCVRSARTTRTDSNASIG